MVDEDSLDMVLDTSVLINLLASGAMELVLTCFNSKKLVIAQVYRETKRHPIDGSDCSNYLNELATTDVIDKITINTDHKKTLELYLELGENLGDGEAAVIAYAATKEDCLIVLDDKKARRICREQFPSIKILCSVDLFQHYLTQCEPDREEFRQILYKAMTVGRMRVFEDKHDKWVRQILGKELIPYCHSLKQRKW